MRVRNRLSLACFTALAACASAPDFPYVARSTSATASWPVGYKTLPELTRASDVVLLGTIASHGDNQSEGSPRVVFQVQPIRFLKGQARLHADNPLLLRQTGNATLDDPLYKKGQRVILFLRELEQGVFGVTGGSSGRFEVIDGRISALTRQIELAPETTEQEFLNQIATIVERSN